MVAGKKDVVVFSEKGKDVMMLSEPIVLIPLWAMIVSIPPLLLLWKFANEIIGPAWRGWRLWLIPAPLVLFLIGHLSDVLAHAEWHKTHHQWPAWRRTDTVAWSSEGIYWVALAVLVVAPFLITAFSRNGLRFAGWFWMMYFFWIMLVLGPVALATGVSPMD